VIWLAEVHLRNRVRVHGLGPSDQLWLFVWGRDRESAEAHLASWLVCQRVVVTRRTLRPAGQQELHRFPMPEHILALPSELLPESRTLVMH
jgi:hypothetical protein